MVVDTRRLPVEILAAAAVQVAETGDLRVALAAIADGAVEATGAELVVLRVLDEDGLLWARAVAPVTSTLAAEVTGTHAECEPLIGGSPSAPIARLAARAQPSDVLTLPARAGAHVVGTLELVGTGELGEDERAAAGLAAALLALAVRTLAPDAGAVAAVRRVRWLELAGEALAAGGDPRRVEQQALRIAVETTGARGGVLWSCAGGERPTLLGSLGTLEDGLDRAAALVQDAVATWRPAAVEHDPGLPAGASHVATLTLGQPPFAALQLFFAPDSAPVDADLAPLAAFAARAAHALRSGEQARAVELELDRTRALVDVVGEAISRLSLAHTLETAVERIAELLQVDQVGVYLREGSTLFAAAGRGVAGGYDEIAGRLLEVLRGPLRARATIHAHVEGQEPALAGVRSALAAAGQQAAVAVPLSVREESVGLLIAYPGDRRLDDSDTSLLTALAAQLGVAVQNARLHERTRDQEQELTDVLVSERKASRQVNALYAISRSFAQTLSLDSTLAAVAETLVRELGVDAAVIRMPDERGDQFVPRGVHVADSRLAAAVRTILERPQPRPSRTREPVLLDTVRAQRLGGAHALLLPFLEKGSTAALIPIATATELLAQLTILSLDPATPIADETLATAQTIAQQAALAIDNARLYQQQKQFAETMQQSLLPRERPAVPGIEIGAVYEPAAQVDVGGDVFDFLELPDGRLAVVLGDVTGHGIDATADMAMAKFVFRSLAREHSDPSEFLAYANDVVVREIAVGKFITMVYVTIGAHGEVVCAGAGHPEPRLVLPDGTVHALACGGLALGIDSDQVYEGVTATLPAGGAVVLYTDGVIEARSGGELFGSERLDEVLAANAGRTAQELADEVLIACRGFAGGALADDCAIVVLKRT
jgi:serine phosphatase RsbU (regulator of sigma subunit)